MQNSVTLFPSLPNTKSHPQYLPPFQLSNFILSLVLHSCVWPSQFAYCPGHLSCSELLGGPPRMSRLGLNTHWPSCWECWQMMAFIQFPLRGFFSNEENCLTQDSHSFQGTAYIHWQLQRGCTITWKSHPSFLTASEFGEGLSFCDCITA